MCDCFQIHYIFFCFPWDLYGVHVRPVAPFGSTSSKPQFDPALIHRSLPDELLFEVSSCFPSWLICILSFCSPPKAVGLMGYMFPFARYLLGWCLMTWEDQLASAESGGTRFGTLCCGATRAWKLGRLLVLPRTIASCSLSMMDHGGKCGSLDQEFVLMVLIFSLSVTPTLVIASLIIQTLLCIFLILRSLRE